MIQSDLELAHRLATVADEVALRFFRRSMADTHRKADGTAVTPADLAVERAVVEQLAQHRPRDGILSEEGGTLSVGRRRWILDPIDGTAGFLAGKDHWGAHIALEIEGTLAIAIVTRPTHNRRWWACRGQRAYASDTADPLDRSSPLAPGRHRTLSGARVGLLTRREESEIPALIEGRGAGVTVATRDHSVVIDLVEGRLDAVISEDARTPWDHSPAHLLTVEAGGTFTDRQGGISADLAPLIYGNGLLDRSLRKALNQAGPSPR